MQRYEVTYWSKYPCFGEGVNPLLRYWGPPLLAVKPFLIHKNSRKDNVNRVESMIAANTYGVGCLYAVYMLICGLFICFTCIGSFNSQQLSKKVDIIIPVLQMRVRYRLI